MLVPTQMKSFPFGLAFLVPHPGRNQPAQKGQKKSASYSQLQNPTGQIPLSLPSPLQIESRQISCTTCCGLNRPWMPRPPFPDHPEHHARKRDREIVSNRKTAQDRAREERGIL